MWERRCAISAVYNEAFREFQELKTPVGSAGCQHAWHLYMLRLNLNQLTIDRSQFIAELKNRNIGVSVHFIPLHIHPYYRSMYGYLPEDFPIALREYEREISLPIYSTMTDSDVADVIRAVSSIASQYRARQYVQVLLTSQANACLG
jgi:dTDP-4-amino-4,6-dideoxygalactose transaminase